MSVLLAATVPTELVHRFHDVLRKASKIRKRSLVYIHSGETPNLEPPDASVVVEVASESVINQVFTPSENRDKYLRFLDRGYLGIVAHDGTELIARGWVVPPESETVPSGLPGWVAELDVYWLTHARTAKGYRNRGWHKYVLTRRLEWVYDRDPAATVYTDTTAENPSRYSFVATGFEPCGTMTTYHLGHPSVAIKQVGVWDPEAEHPPLPATGELSQ